MTTTLNRIRHQPVDTQQMVTSPDRARTSCRQGRVPQALPFQPEDLHEPVEPRMDSRAVWNERPELHELKNGQNLSQTETPQPELPHEDLSQPNELRFTRFEHLPAQDMLKEMCGQLWADVNSDGNVLFNVEGKQSIQPDDDLLELQGNTQQWDQRPDVRNDSARQTMGQQDVPSDKGTEPGFLERMSARITEQLQGEVEVGSHQNREELIAQILHKEGWWSTGNSVPAMTTIIQQILQHYAEEVNWQRERQKTNGLNCSQQPTITEWWKGEAKRRPKDPPRDNEILESLKKLAQSRGYSVPIYTIALRSPKPGCRFLKRLSDTTGGKFMELDMKWDSKCLPVKGEELDDMLWAQSLIEEYQRKNAESGVVESIKDITKRVEAQFEQKRHLPRLEAYAQLVKLAEIEHQKRVQEVRKQNEEINLRTKQVYEQLSADISERNKRNLETSKTLWKANVADIRQRNEKIAEEIEKWKVSFAAVQQRNEQAKNNAKEQFARDLKQVCEKNDQMMERAKENYQWEIEKLNKRNADTLADAVRGQQELDEMVAIVNKATREEYEVAVAAVKASNADLLFKARLSYEQQIAAIKIDNELAIQEARMQYNQKCEEVNEDNARRKVALAQRLEAIKRSREDAIAIHKEAVARCLAEHEQMGKTYSALNQANENEARIAWKKECEETERENMEAAQQAMREFSNEQVRVREENLKLAEVRMAVQRRAEEVDRKNEELVKQKKLEWKAACAEAEEKHRAAVAEAKESHVKLVEKVKVRNAERLQASLLEHKVKVAAIESYNETVRPYVEASNAVRSELSRIQGFVRCMADTILQDEQEGGSSSSSRKAASVVVQEQGGRKSQVESDLETLSRCDVALNTEMLIQALQMAYGGRSAAAEESAAAAAAAMQEEEEVVCAHHTQRSLSALTPIHPARATTHHCLASPRCCAAA